MSDQFRVGIVGVGIMGQRHAHALNKNPHTTVAALADLDMEHCRRVGEQLGIPAYSSADEMLAQERIDLVVIATPDPYHRQPLMTILGAGVKRVLIEKPFATSIDDAISMYDAIVNSNASVFVLFGTRARIANAASRTILEASLIGEPTYVSARVADNISVPRLMWRDRSDNWALRSSSSVHFLYSHRIDQLRWLYQPAEVESVTAIGRNRILGGASDFVESFLTWDNELVSRIHTGWVDFGGQLVQSESLLQGTRGMIVNNELPAFGRPVPGWQVVFDDIDDATLHDVQDLLLDRGIESRRVVERYETENTPSVVRGLELLNTGIPRQFIDYLIDGFIEESDCPESWERFQGSANLPSARDGLEQTRVCCTVEESIAANATLAVR